MQMVLLPMVMSNIAMPTQRHTLGAGDTFVAAAIYSLIKESSVEDALIFACRLAGFKCGMAGNDGLVKAFYNYQNNNCY